jgi:predicted transcriptional regulator
MAVPKSVITDSELGVLKLLWSSPASSAREITGHLYEEVNPSSIGTVQKLIARLEEKGMLARDDSQTPHRFEATLSREDIAGMQLDEFADKLSEGSLSPFVLHLVQAKKLSKSDKEEIRRLLGEE